MYAPLRSDGDGDGQGEEIALTEFSNKDGASSVEEQRDDVVAVSLVPCADDGVITIDDVVVNVEMASSMERQSQRAQAKQSLKGALLASLCPCSDCLLYRCLQGNSIYVTHQACTSVHFDQHRSAFVMLTELASILDDSCLSLMLFAAMCFSLMALMVNAVSATGVPTFELVFFRSLIVSSGYLYSTGGTLIGKTRHRPLLVLRGALGTISQACYYFALSKLFLADAVVLSFLAPVFTTLMAYLVLGEALVALDFIGASLSIAGVIMIARPPFLFGESSSTSDDEISGLMRWLAIASALISSLFSAFAYVTVRKLGTAVSAMLLVNYFSLAGVVMTLPLTLTLETPVLPHGVPALLLFGVCLSAWFGQIALNRGLQLERAGAAASVNYVGVVFAFSFQVLILHQPVNLWTAAGAALICTYAVLLFVKKFMALQATKA